MNHDGNINAIELFAAAPVPAPRPLTPRGKRRSWGEAGVRGWWILALVVAAIAIYFVAMQFWRSVADRWLAQNGAPVDAEVIEVNGNPLKNKLTSPEVNAAFKLRFMLPGSGAPGAVDAKMPETKAFGISLPQPPQTRPADEDTYLLFTSGALQGLARRIEGFSASGQRITLADSLPFPPKTGDHFLFGCRPVTILTQLRDQDHPLAAGMEPASSVVPLYVDRSNPQHWIEKRDISLRHNLLVGIMLLPVVLAMAAVALVMRQRVLRVWRDGEPMLAVVVETRQSAAAPLSRQVHMTLRDSRDGRVFSALIPTRCGLLNAGDLVYVLAPHGQPQHAIVAGLYS